MREPTLSPEIWLPVVGYEGIYSVSNRGRVRRDLANRGTKAGNILAQAIKNGYPMVSLWREGHRRNHLMHIVVAEAFVGPRLLGFDVNHKDGIRTNANAENLEYVTRSENIRHAQQTMGSYHGERHPNSKLTNAAVLEIRRRAPRNERECHELAEQFGVTTSAIWYVASGKGWKSVRLNGEAA
jgi:hypothetical protein